MASPTYTLISSNVLTSSAASVTFSSIPSTYTDLVLKLSTRSGNAANTSIFYLELNGDATSQYTWTNLEADGATPSSGTSGALSTQTQVAVGNGGNSTSNTFTSTDIYIPSYTASIKKPFSSIAAFEANATTAYLRAQANLYQPTTSISSVRIYTNSSPAFVSGSSFYLYGIKNS